MMTGEVGSEIHLEINDLNLISQEEADSPSDSGQGSFETIEPLSERDSDEEIFTSKKLKSRKVIQYSDSETEDTNATPEETTYDSVENEKENLYPGKSGKIKRIYKTLADSDESNTEESSYQENPKTQETPCLELSLQSGNSVDFTNDKKTSKKSVHDKERTGRKAKVKSKRRLEKEERKMEKIRQLKKKKTKNEENDVEQPLNDSGCLLADKDLFETGLEEGNNSPLEDEESLESIRASMKNKVKNHKKKESSLESGVISFEEESELSKGTMKKERKAAKLSKEALKKLHSETQRLIRESALNLPYHIPANKTVHDFFKCKPRPTCQGNAMALLKSSKYQSITDTAKKTEMNGDHCNKGSEQTSTGGEMEMNESPVVSKEPQIFTGSDETCTTDLVRSEELESKEKQKQNDHTPSSEDSAVLQQESGVLENTTSKEHHVGGLVTSEPHALAGEEGQLKTEETKGKLEELVQQTKSSVVPEKVRRFTVDRLKQLGVDVSIKPRLAADKDSFVILDEPETNRAKQKHFGSLKLSANQNFFLKHLPHARSCRAYQDKLDIYPNLR